MELGVGQEVQLVRTKQADLKGCRGIIEEIVEGKAQILLVERVRRVRVDIRKLRASVVVERVEVLPADFAEVGVHAHSGIILGTMKQNLKAADKKMVLKLHPNRNKNNQEKATELFKALNIAYQMWKGNTARTRRRGGNPLFPLSAHNHTQTFSSTVHTTNQFFAGRMSCAKRPHNRPSNNGWKRIVGTEIRNTHGGRGCGQQEKVQRRTHGRDGCPRHKDATRTRVDHKLLARNSDGT